MVNITVDEKVTKSAATVPATAENISDPFIFAIVERDTGTILFFGRVKDPQE